MWTALVVLALAACGGWWWYQQRQASPSTDAAADVAAAGEGDAGDPAMALAGGGAVLIDARPWGRLETVQDNGSGEVVALPSASPFTPRLVSLPTGSYEVTLSHPDGGSQSCRVTVEVGKTAACEVRFFDIEASALLGELGWP